MNIYYLTFHGDGSVKIQKTVRAMYRETAILKGFKSLTNREQEYVDYCEVIEDANNK